MYGFVHNSWSHLLGNVFTQLLVGLPLELSHSSWRVALVYLFGIVYGGLGREIFGDPNVPLAGASGGVFALITAHLSHLFLNWNDDTYVFRQRLTWDARRTNENKQHKPPQALPADFARNIRYVRLIITFILLIFELYGGMKCVGRNAESTCGEQSVSRWAHGFGALSGFIMGIVVLRARRLRKIEKRLKYVLLTIVYGLPLSYVLIECIKTVHRNSFITCDLIQWTKYEKICQDTCYEQKYRNANYSCMEVFKIHEWCAPGHVTSNATNMKEC